MAHSHDHEHGHSHGGSGHSHAHAPKDFGTAFLIGIGLNSAFIILEIVFGLLSNSLALLADAAHNVADVLGLVVAWIAIIVAKRPASQRRTFGWKRATILAALANAILLLVGVGGILWEAVTRIGKPVEVIGTTVIWVAGLGILVNGATALLFMSGRKSDLNIHGAFLHMAADAAVSAGVMISGAVILFTAWDWLDPVMSIAVGIFILMSTWGLFTGSLHLTFDGVPETVDPAAIRRYFETLPGITAVHHIHIWPISTTETALTAHLVKESPLIDDGLLATIRYDLEHDFGVSHPTIQFESGAGCEDADDEKLPSNR